MNLNDDDLEYIPDKEFKGMATRMFKQLSGYVFTALFIQQSRTVILIAQCEIL